MGARFTTAGARQAGRDASPDVLAEFKTLDSNYSPDYGISSGGTVTMVLKSGTQKFHGGLWEFNRNDAYDANYYFSKRAGQAPPELRLNIFGGDIGGPVFIPGIYNTERKKTFFFWSEEWRRYIQGANPPRRIRFRRLISRRPGRILRTSRGTSRRFQRGNRRLQSRSAGSLRSQDKRSGKARTLCSRWPDPGECISGECDSS